MTAPNPRALRLEQEQKRLADWCGKRSHAVALLGTEGSPAAAYTLRFNCASVARLAADGSPVMAASQTLRITLPSNYPMAQPTVMITTPVFHPNIWVSGQVCLGHYWSMQRTLDQLADQLWRILVWDPEVADPDSAANRDAAIWYLHSFDRKPFDRVDPAAPAGAATEPPPAEKPRIRW